MPPIDFIVKLDSEGRTELKIDGFGSATGRFEFDLSGGIRQVLNDIEAGYCKPEDLKKSVSCYSRGSSRTMWAGFSRWLTFRSLTSLSICASRQMDG